MPRFLKTKFLYWIFFSNISLFSFAQQYYKAGDMFINYRDINPDTLIYAFFIGQPDLENYFIDVNGDFQNDLQFRAYCFQSAGTQSYYLKISSLNQNSFIRYGRTDSVFNPNFSSWMIAKIADPLLIGDTINPQIASWDSTLYITYFAYCCGASQTVTDWNSDAIDKYIAVKHLNNTDTIYGWIRVNCDPGCFIKDYSFGSGLISVNEIDKDNFKIFPNPAKNKIFVQQPIPGKAEIKIFDIVGRQSLPTLFNPPQNFEIDISTLNSGIYFIIVKSSERSYIEKIIVEK